MTRNNNNDQAPGPAFASSNMLRANSICSFLVRWDVFSLFLAFFADCSSVRQLRKLMGTTAGCERSSTNHITGETSAAILSFSPHTIYIKRSMVMPCSLGGRERITNRCKCVWSFCSQNFCASHHILPVSLAFSSIISIQYSGISAF